jgi:endonuclease/exonuclease/phosphatase family metal-dependent hydrolase
LVGRENRGARSASGSGSGEEYHAQNGEKHGEEKRPTFFLYRHRQKPFHFDYVFLPERWRRAVRSIEVGAPDEWLTRSDHLPLTVSLNMTALST